MLKSLGATVHLTPEEAGHDDRGSHLALAKRLLAQFPHGVILDQYSNPRNPEAHHQGTAGEIIADTDGHVDAIVAGAGTGGTITGIATHLKQIHHHALIIGTANK